MVRFSSNRTSRLVFGVLANLMALSTLLALGSSVGAASAEGSTLHATVTRVNPGLAPYNPQLASAGIPVEEVTFAVRPLPRGNHFICTISVRHRGKLVGHTQASFNGPWDYPASADRFGVQVDVGKRTLKAAPSDVRVKCRT